MPKSGGFVPDEEQTTNRALSSPLIDDLHQILELHQPWHCTFQARLSRGCCYTQTSRAGKGLAILLKSHSMSLGSCRGSSHGFSSGNAENKLSVDFKDVLASVKVMLSSVASIIPTTVVAGFFLQIPLLFLVPFIVKQIHAVMLLSSEILCARIPCAHWSFHSPLPICPWPDGFDRFCLPFSAQSRTALRKASSYLILTSMPCFIYPGNCKCNVEVPSNQSVLWLSGIKSGGIWNTWSRQGLFQLFICGHLNLLF